MIQQPESNLIDHTKESELFEVIPTQTTSESLLAQQPTTESSDSFPTSQFEPSKFQISSINSKKPISSQDLFSVQEEDHENFQEKDPLLFEEPCEWDNSLPFHSTQLLDDVFVYADSNSLSSDDLDKLPVASCSDSVSSPSPRRGLQNNHAVSLIEDEEERLESLSPKALAESSLTLQLSKKSEDSLSFVVLLNDDDVKQSQHDDTKSDDTEKCKAEVVVQLSSTKPSFTVSLQTSFATKNGVKAIKPCAFSNKRTTISDKDKTLLLSITSPPLTTTQPLSRNDFDLFIVVKESCHGENVVVIKDGKQDQFKKLDLDPEGNSLLQVVKETVIDDHTIEISCKITTSNNYGWKTKHPVYNFVVQSKLANVYSALSEGFKVTQSVS
ncbi:hypothetical protein C9374_014101 [Naegleria lovaniensis]|uniref:Uncharacterized protein n=1 Tax=Naegleria lovaniensis TaxID=51637 RepID=A0AA88H0N5_NAELO|nr:uncharacterized protein C9374_014101 [Naegleria lovaniensis]KAG2389541.1 hypothetical protein C9374_014101 [Naegleria lovaniensis]